MRRQNKFSYFEEKRAAKKNKSMKSLWKSFVNNRLSSPKSVSDAFHHLAKQPKPFIAPQQQLKDGGGDAAALLHPTTLFHELNDEYHFIKMSSTTQGRKYTSVKQVQSFTQQIQKLYGDYETATRHLQDTLRAELQQLENHMVTQNQKTLPVVSSIALYNDNYVYFSFHDPELVVVRMKVEEDDSDSVLRHLIMANGGQQLESYVIQEYEMMKSSDKKKKKTSTMTKSTADDASSWLCNFPPVELVFDKNALIQRLKEKWIAGGKKERVTMPPDTISISSDQQYIAYRYRFGGMQTIEVANIQTKQIIDSFVTREDVHGVEFSIDSQTLFYTLTNSNHRPYKIMSHRIAQPTIEDVMLLQEDEESFFLEFYRSKDSKCLFVNSGNRSTSECFLIDEHKNAISLVKSRREGELFFPEHHNGSIYAITNVGGSSNLQVVKLNGREYTGDENSYSVLLPSRPDTRIDDVEMFNDYLVLYEKKWGLDQIRVIPMNDDKAITQESYIINVPECSNIHHLINKRYNSRILLLQISSILHNEQLYEVDLATKSLNRINVGSSETQVNAENTLDSTFNPDDFIVRQIQVPSSTPGSTVKIPMVIAHHKQLVLDGNNPTLMIGYGAYGHATDLSFEIQRCLLLKKHFVVAFPQVRGGGDGDVNWHKDGSMMNKKNSFADFIDCTQYLIDHKYTNAKLICAKGVSAGGLLVASSALTRPDLYKSIILKVPFLDVTSTMLDKSLPLTELEQDEWGSPLDYPDHFQYIQSYSPYDKLNHLTAPMNDLPHMFLSAALNDFHVPSWQIFKFLARFWRIQKEQKSELPLVVCRILEDASHGDEAGKHGSHEDIAAEYAFIFLSLGIENHSKV